MAIKGNTSCRGLHIQSAYIRVSDLRIDNISKTVTASITLHASPDTGPLPIDGDSIFQKIKIRDNNPVKSVYDHIKTLDQFAGFEDC